MIQPETKAANPEQRNGYQPDNTYCARLQPITQKVFANKDEQDECKNNVNEIRESQYSSHVNLHIGLLAQAKKREPGDILKTHG